MASSTENKSTDPASSPLESTVDDDKVSLIYNNNKKQTFEHSRKKLSKISMYFKTLFERDYSDSKSREIRITHSEDVKIFQEFLNCANCEQPFKVVEFTVNDALKKYKDKNFEELLKLLNLTFYFTADNVVNCILYILVSYWFDPDHVLKIWHESKKMGYCDLQNAAFAMILDTFQRIRKKFLLNLSKLDIEQIIKNPMLRCSDEYFEDIVNEWAQKNHNSLNTTISEFKESKIHMKNRYLQCITGFTTIPETGNKTIIYIWDGTKLNELSDISDSIKPFSLVGSQILGRGFSIYFVCGEKSIGDNNFNTDVVRYCLITKQCYKVARLSIPRRDMVAAFVGNKLVLVGGVGMNGEKLRSVQILDIHTGTWEDGQLASENFDENHPICVCGDKLFIVNTHIHCYNVNRNKWEIWENITKPCGVTNIISHKNQVHVALDERENENRLFLLERVRHPLSTDVCFEILESLDPELYKQYPGQARPPFNLVSDDNHLIWFTMLNPTELKIEIGEFKSEYTYEILSEKSFIINNNFCLKRHVGCFNILNFQALHPKT